MFLKENQEKNGRRKMGSKFDKSLEETLEEYDETLKNLAER